MHLIIGKRQPLQVSMSTYAYNLIGSKELSQTLKHMRIEIPYNDALNELSAWWPPPQKGVTTICHLENKIILTSFLGV